MLINVLQLVLWIGQLVSFALIDWFALVPIKGLAAALSVLPGALATTMVAFEEGSKVQRGAEVVLGFLATVVSWFTQEWWWWIPVALVAIWNCSQVLFFVFVNVARAAAAIANLRQGKPAPQAPQPQPQVQPTPQQGKGGGFFARFRRK